MQQIGEQHVEAGRKRRRDVVTAFVQRPADGKVLVVQRSEKVGTYRLQWGGVSGGVEGHESLVARALTEIWEEVGLTAEQLGFVRSGRPLYVDDGRLHFAVHPFLFSLADPRAQVRLNWENVDWSWVEPDAIASKDTVPGLDATWERLFVTGGQQQALGRIRQDRAHGAAQLAHWALTALHEFAIAACEEQHDAEAEGSHALEAVRNFGYHLATARPSMAPLANTVAAVLAAVHRDLHDRASAFDITVGEVYRAVDKACSDERTRLEGLAPRLREQALSLLRDGITVMTLSYSSTILEVVRQAAADGLRLKAIVCESRPLNEGVSLAAAWAAAGVECTVVTDAQAGAFVGQADLVLVGADAIGEEGVVNKVGTYLLALAARERQVPVYAVADTSKLFPGTAEALAHPGGRAGQAAHEEEDADEVASAWAVAAPGVHVRNVYFEATPLDLFAGVVTERGRVEVAGIAAAVEALRETYCLAFQLALPEE